MKFRPFSELAPWLIPHVNANSRIVQHLPPFPRLTIQLSGKDARTSGSSSSALRSHMFWYYITSGGPLTAIGAHRPRSRAHPERQPPAVPQRRSEVRRSTHAGHYHANRGGLSPLVCPKMPATTSVMGWRFSVSSACLQGAKAAAVSRDGNVWSFAVKKACPDLAVDACALL
jgi:hypothetical protein